MQSVPLLRMPLQECRLKLSRFSPDLTFEVSRSRRAHKYAFHFQDKSTAVVMEAMLSARSTDIASVVKGLSSSQMDVLMKYIYRGMAQPELFNSAVLLTWHEKVDTLFCMIGGTILMTFNNFRYLKLEARGRLFEYWSTGKQFKTMKTYVNIFRKTLRTTPSRGTGMLNGVFLQTDFNNSIYRFIDI